MHSTGAIGVVRTSNMTDTFKWEQDRAGGDNGTATYVFSESQRSVSVPMYSFKDAFSLNREIQREVIEARHSGRVSILNEVARISP